MSITEEKVGAILARFSLLFPLHEGAKSSWPVLVEIWAGLLRDFSEDEVNAAARQLALKLKRFPVPADFVEQIEAARNAAEATHG